MFYVGEKKEERWLWLFSVGSVLVKGDRELDPVSSQLVKGERNDDSTRTCL